MVVSEASLISIVDDDESIRESISTLLRSAGYRVHLFASGEAFLDSDILKETKCLILDVRMPGIDGVELQGRLNAEKVRVPIVFITGHGNEQLRRLVIDAGAVDMLDKPFAAWTLLEMIKSALDRDAGSSRKRNIE